MQLKITSTLLQDVYTTNNYFLKKSLLVNQGRLLRASGIDGLKSCTECLSEAIKVLVCLIGFEQNKNCDEYGRATFVTNKNVCSSRRTN